MLTVPLLPLLKIFFAIYKRYMCVCSPNHFLKMLHKKKLKPISKKKREKDPQGKINSNRDVLHHSCCPSESLSCFL